MAEIDETRNLIEINRRRLQKLEEQRSRLGYDTPPQILMEIEDIKEAIQRLMIAVEQLAGSQARAGSPPASSVADEGKTKVDAEESAVAIGDHANAVNTKLDLRGANITNLILSGESKGSDRAENPPKKSAAGHAASAYHSEKSEYRSSRSNALQVFMSYASEDRDAVREIYKRLRSLNVDAWLDEENLLPGQDWQVEIRKAVRATHVVIIFLSHKTVTKAGYVQKEIKYALDVADEQPEGAIFLIPAKLEECEIPDRLSHLQWVNLHDDRGWSRLLAALERRAQDIGMSPPQA